MQPLSVLGKNDWDKWRQNTMNVVCILSLKIRNFNSNEMFQNIALVDRYSVESCYNKACWWYVMTKFETII